MSTLGRVRSASGDMIVETRWDKPTIRTVAGRVLAPLKHTGGYLGVHLYQNGAGKRHFIHALVLEAFVGARPPRMQACHNNGDKTDNRLANLRWGTPAENQKDRARHGTQQKGKPKPTKKMSPVLAEAIRRLYAEVQNKSKVARILDLPRTTVADVINGRTFKNA